ncbi:MAG: TetR/AcrR family transcriptional regulator, partial [Sphingomonadales bacterium]|nr:TetR/AcrR family transcriptional regulator [Sphingomonadales bacterium]
MGAGKQAVATVPAPAPSRRSPGRPTREQAIERDRELLDTALDLFLENGFEGTSIEAITAAVGMAKRTIYSRYEDKRGLFRAALQRA